MCVQRKKTESSNEADRINLIRSALINWGKKNYSNFPWRASKNRFHALIVEVMLQRTKAEQVVPVYNAFTIRYPKPVYISSDKSQLLSLLKPLGLFWRNKKIFYLINELSKREKIPIKFNELVKLPGVGQYAASAFLSLHLSFRATIIDSNVVRLWTRVFKIKKTGETRRKKDFLLLVDKITPQEKFREFNYAVLDLTRTICKPKPLCNKCPLKANCKFYFDTKIKTSN